MGLGTVRWGVVVGLHWQMRRKSPSVATARGCLFFNVLRERNTGNREPREARTWKGGSGSLAPLQPRPAVSHRNRTWWVDPHSLTSWTCQGSNDIWSFCLRKTFLKCLFTCQGSPPPFTNGNAPFWTDIVWLVVERGSAGRSITVVASFSRANSR